jgi:fructose-bisphosphate aldolase, class II
VPVVALKEILDRAFTDRYGVAAFNIINDLTIEAVLAAAIEERAPVILQTSVKTVRSYGREQLMGIFRALARKFPVPVTLHLDHCPNRAVISDCLEGGWNSVLFDAHGQVLDAGEGGAA